MFSKHMTTTPHSYRTRHAPFYCALVYADIPLIIAPTRCACWLGFVRNYCRSDIFYGCGDGSWDFKNRQDIFISAAFWSGHFHSRKDFKKRNFQWMLFFVCRYQHSAASQSGVARRCAREPCENPSANHCDDQHVCRALEGAQTYLYLH